jgi:hypothetical protein
LESRDAGAWEESLTLTLCSRNGTKVCLTPACAGFRWRVETTWMKNHLENLLEVVLAKGWSVGGLDSVLRGGDSIRSHFLV